MTPRNGAIRLDATSAGSRRVRHRHRPAVPPDAAGCRQRLRQAEHHVIFDRNIGLRRRIGRRAARRRACRAELALAACWLRLRLGGGLLAIGGCCCAVAAALLRPAAALPACDAASRRRPAASADFRSGNRKFGVGVAASAAARASSRTSSGATTISTAIGSAVTEPNGCTSVKISTSARTDR